MFADPALPPDSVLAGQDPVRTSPARVIALEQPVPDLGVAVPEDDRDDSVGSDDPTGFC